MGHARVERNASSNEGGCQGRGMLRELPGVSTWTRWCARANCARGEGLTRCSSTLAAIVTSIEPVGTANERQTCVVVGEKRRALAHLEMGLGCGWPRLFPGGVSGAPENLSRPEFRHMRDLKTTAGRGPASEPPAWIRQLFKVFHLPVHTHQQQAESFSRTTFEDHAM